MIVVLEQLIDPTVVSEVPAGTPLASGAQQGQGPSGSAGGGGAKQDDVVDAEFTEVKDKK